MDKNKTFKTLDKLYKTTSLKDAQSIVRTLCDNLNYYGSQKKLESDNNYLQLCDYLQDLTTVSSVGNKCETAAEFIENIEDSETDLLIYLDNFVSDDTKYDSVEEFIESDFKDIKEFIFYLINNYFQNNLKYFMDKLQI
jgi:hypothetical protein